MLTTQNTQAIRRIEAAIGYTFRDKRLLVQVFTRKSFMRLDPEAPDNEVLEFYGDTLLSYHVTTYFVDKFAHMLPDGLYFMRTVEQFTEMRSHYVRNQYLADRIKQLIPGIERLLRAQNPRFELAKDNQKAYADLFESLVGAVYLDSCQDGKLIRAFILRHLNIEPKDPVTTPEDEWSPTAMLSLPAAEAATQPVITPPAEEPDTTLEPLPVPTDRTECHPDRETDLLPTPATVPEPATTSPVAEMTPTVPATNREQLDTFCRSAGYDLPAYTQAPPNSPKARPVAACTLKYRNTQGRMVKISLNDSGRTMAEAEEKVATKMLRKLMEQAAPSVASVPTLTEDSIQTPAEAPQDPPTKIVAEMPAAAVSSDAPPPPETAAEAIPTDPPVESNTPVEANPSVEADAADPIAENNTTVETTAPAQPAAETPFPAAVTAPAPKPRRTGRPKGTRRATAQVADAPKTTPITEEAPGEDTVVADTILADTAPTATAVETPVTPKRSTRKSAAKAKSPDTVPVDSTTIPATEPEVAPAKVVKGTKTDGTKPAKEPKPTTAKAAKTTKKATPRAAKKVTVEVRTETEPGQET